MLNFGSFDSNLIRDPECLLFSVLISTDNTLKRQHIRFKTKIIPEEKYATKKVIVLSLRGSL